MIKPHRDKRTGKTHNLLLRSHEERMTDDFVYEETKMIETVKNYKLTLTEYQARQLYELLQCNNERLIIGCGYDDLRELYNELKNLFDTGVR